MMVDGLITLVALGEILSATLDDCMYQFLLDEFVSEVMMEVKIACLTGCSTSFYNFGTRWANVLEAAGKHRHRCVMVASR